jgi:glutathione S-transferase
VAGRSGGARACKGGRCGNARRLCPGQGRTPEALENISRIEALWRETRRGFAAGGPFLFGEHFGAADAMYAPVVTRFLSYRPDLAADSWAYCDAVRAHPLVRRWYDEAAAEPPEWAALHG